MNHSAVSVTYKEVGSIRTMVLDCGALVGRKEFTMRISHLIATGAIGALSACSAPPPPPPLQGELILNKYGNPVGCVEGVYIPNANYQDQCLPPADDECDPGQALPGTNVDYCDRPPVVDQDGGGGATPPRGTGSVPGRP